MKTIGLLLRRLTEALDGDVSSVYQDQEVSFSPRYFPIFRALLREDSQSLRDLASATGLTHSAISQTSAQMRAAGLIELVRGQDGRERHATITPFGRAQLAILEPVWAAIEQAADDLDQELGFAFGTALEQMLAVLGKQPFRDRILQKLAGVKHL